MNQANFVFKPRAAFDRRELLHIHLHPMASNGNLPLRAAGYAVGTRHAGPLQEEQDGAAMRLGELRVQRLRNPKRPVRGVLVSVAEDRLLIGGRDHPALAWVAVRPVVRRVAVHPAPNRGRMDLKPLSQCAERKLLRVKEPFDMTTLCHR